ncbi:hypothetical protein N7492_001660 [Penicillium capsulatum]|uniref:Uncharacterized protein n=1 Tax=Penicillium capsulatum TaxID=69766 RepID=A0A9W9M0H8_9EURO|nr:hypothetical protein N7492_001660 [Penicillium capsulatum]KAJ6129287.1 hypothetical protein N7512_002067 [Penicillium capsulatum]
MHYRCNHGWCIDLVALEFDRVLEQLLGLARFDPPAFHGNPRKNCHSQRTTGLIWDVTRSRILPFGISQPVFFTSLPVKFDCVVDPPDLLVLRKFNEVNEEVVFLQDFAEKRTKQSSSVIFFDLGLEVLFVHSVVHFFGDPFPALKHLPDVARAGVFAFHSLHQAISSLVEDSHGFVFKVYARIPLDVGFLGIFLQGIKVRFKPLRIRCEDTRCDNQTHHIGTMFSHSVFELLHGCLLGFSFGRFAFFCGVATFLGTFSFVAGRCRFFSFRSGAFAFLRWLFAF